MPGGFCVLSPESSCLLQMASSLKEDLGGGRVCPCVQFACFPCLGACFGGDLLAEACVGWTALLWSFAFLFLISAQARRPAEFKHIIKRRKRN